MKAEDYDKIELELLLKGYQLHAVKSDKNEYYCNMLHIETNRYIFTDTIGTTFGFTEKQAKRRIIADYSRNKKLQ